MIIKYKSYMHLTIALVLFIFDALVLNQGIIAIITLLIIVLVFVPKIMVALHKKLSIKARLSSIGIYSVMAIAILTANYSNNIIAKSRADTLIVPIEAYHQATGRYPATLAQLTPDYIPSIPKAKYTFNSNEFRYSTYQDTAFLSYVNLPPFGDHSYNFKQRTWRYFG